MISDDQLKDVCIYTTKKKEDLIRDIKGGGKGLYQIKTKMITAVSLLERCKQRGLPLPVIISDANCCINLIAHGVLTSILVGEDGTEYGFENLQPIHGNHKISELKLISTGDNISENFIRTYAICYQPDFILKNT